MRQLVLTAALALIFATGALANDLNLDWVYHDDDDYIDDRVTEKVPGQEFSFIGNGSEQVADDAPIILYVLTANNFAGEPEEQVFARWWNGETEHWVMGSWENNIKLGEGLETAGTFHGMPVDGEVTVDLWKIEINPEITNPGDNYYVLQIKGFEEGNISEAFVLRDSAGEDGEENNLGQALTRHGDYFGHDWKITVTE